MHDEIERKQSLIAAQKCNLHKLWSTVRTVLSFLDFLRFCGYIALVDIVKEKENLSKKNATFTFSLCKVLRTDEENERREKEAQRTLAKHEECYDPNTSSNVSETDVEANITKESKTKCKQPKLSVFSPSVCAVADKHQVSHSF